METNFVYMTTNQIDDRKAKIAAIEGLTEIKAAIAAWVKYHQERTRFDNGDIDYEDIPTYNPSKIDDLKKKYPRAAAFLEAERWISTDNPVKVRLGSRAMEKILNDEDPYAVLAEMSRGLDAFCLAQVGS